jgi:ferritin
MDKKLSDAINTQINNELYSGYLYMAMAAYFESSGLEGFAHWMKKQAKEEKEHAMKFWDFLLDRNQKITLKAIAAPETEFSSPIDIFRKTLEHEKKVTAMINGLADLALKLDDKPAQVLLQWYINEQVEEEKNPSKIIDALKIIKDNAAAMYMLDRELAKRGE